MTSFAYFKKIKVKAHQVTFHNMVCHGFVHITNFKELKQINHFINILPRNSVARRLNYCGFKFI